MLKSKLIYVVLMGWVLCACKVTEKNISGSYNAGSESFAEYNTYINLYEDHSFWLSKWINTDKSPTFIGTKGTWKLEGKKLILNSDTTPLILPHIVFAHTNSDSMTVEVQWYNKWQIWMHRFNPVEGAKVRIKIQENWQTFETNKRGKFKIAKQKIDSIDVTATNLVPIHTHLGIVPKGDMRLSLINEYAERICFENQVWQIRRNRIKGMLSNKPLVFKKK